MHFKKNIKFIYSVKLCEDTFSTKTGERYTPLYNHTQSKRNKAVLQKIEQESVIRDSNKPIKEYKHEH